MTDRQTEISRPTTSDGIPHGLMWRSEESSDLETLVSQAVDFLRSRIQPVVQYQQNKYGVVAPMFVFWTVDHATSWRRKLINHIMFLHKALETIPHKDSIFFEVEELENRFQKHISAVNAVLHQYYDADETIKGVDMREDVDELVFRDETLYSLQQALLRDHESLRKKITRQYGRLNRT